MTSSVKGSPLTRQLTSNARKSSVTKIPVPKHDHLSNAAYLAASYTPKLGYPMYKYFMSHPESAFGSEGSLGL